MVDKINRIFINEKLREKANVLYYNMQNNLKIIIKEKYLKKGESLLKKPGNKKI